LLKVLHLGVLRLPGLLAITDAQSALNPAGRQAGRIHWLFMLFCVVLTIIYLVVLALLVRITRSKTEEQPPPPLLNPEPRREKRMTVAVSTGVVLTIVTLCVLLFHDFAAGKSIHLLTDPNPLEIKVTGHQWWWEIKYEDADPSQIVTTANEIHIPVGRVVKLDLDSPDVIHSFWVPNLHGKRDLVPGHPATTWIKAEQPGSFHGQCAEYCGAEHALMRIAVTSESSADFQKWLDAQRQSSVPPKTDAQKRGQQVFLGSTCIMCHSIQGTPARGTVGPDLTHVGSRVKVAADTLPNSSENLSRWILDPHKIKPGVKMPVHNLNPDDLKQLVEYLKSLT